MDLQVKCLNKLGKGTKRVTFRSFSDRIKLINVDIHRRIERTQHDSIDENDINATYFAKALASWSELNKTSSFQSFLRDVRHLASGASLPLLLHHKTTTVELILDHLSRPNCQCAEALLDLIGVLALDLRQEFMSEFSRVLAGLFDRIDPMQPAVLEALFTCIARLFKYLLRYLIPITHILYVDTYCRVLTHKKPFVREFAAETFAYLLRKVTPDLRAAVIAEIIEKSPYDNSNCSSGLTSLFFHCFKLQGRQFHSCMPDILPHVIAASARFAPQTEQFLKSLLVRMNEMTEVKYCEPICNTLYDHALSPDFGRVHGARCLRIWIANRRGSRVTNITKLSNVLENLMKSGHADVELLQLIAVMLMHTDVNPGPLLHYVFHHSNAALAELIKFVEVVRAKVSTTVYNIVLHQIERYCRERAALADSFALLTAGYIPELADVSYKMSLKADHLSELRQMLQSEESALSALTILPHLSHNFNAEIANLLQRYSLLHDLNETAFAAFGLAADLSAYSESIVAKFRQNPTHLVTLQCLNLIADLSPFLEPEIALSILTPNLSHPSEKLRLISLKILHRAAASVCEQAGELFLLMLSISETEPSLETERDVARMVTKIGRIALDNSLPDSLQATIIPFFIGIFRIKFRLFWPPVQECLASLLHIHSFAKTFVKHLEESYESSSVVIAADRENHFSNLEDAGRFTDTQMMFSLMMNTMLLPQCNVANSESQQLGQLLLRFIREQFQVVYRQHRSKQQPSLIKQHEQHTYQHLVLWTKLLGRIKKPKSLPYACELLDFLSILLSRPEAELQRLTVEALLQFKDAALLAHKDALLAICDPNKAREQMTTLSLACSSEDILPEQRSSLLPVVYRLILPKLTAKGKQSSMRAAALTFIGVVSDAELDAFIRVALGTEVLKAPLSMRLSVQSRFVDILTLLHRHFDHRLCRISDEIFVCLGSMVAHHGASLDKSIDSAADMEASCKDGGVVSRDLLRRLFFVAARLVDSFPEVLARQNSACSDIVNVALRWAPRMNQELTQARTGLMDFIIALSSHDELKPVLLVNPEIVRSMFSILAARCPVEDVVQGVIQFANNLIDDNSLSTLQVSELMSSLQVLLCGLLQSESVPNLALSLLNRLVPFVIESALEHDCGKLIQLLLKFTKTSSISDLRTVMKAISSLIVLVPESDRVAYFSSVHRLLLTAADREIRSYICDMATSLQLPEAKPLRDLNSFVITKLENEPDFNLRSATYTSLASWENNFKESFPLFCQILFDLLNPDDSIRRHAEHSLSQWPSAVTQGSDSAPAILNNLIFPQIRSNFSKIRNEKILISCAKVLRSLIAGFQKDFNDLSLLISLEDSETDILHNLLHIQSHRRRRALGRIRVACQNGQVSERCAHAILRPLLLQFLYNAPSLDSATEDEVIRTFSDVAVRQSWSQYKKTLLALIRAMKRNASLFRPLLKATSALIDGWGFDIDIDPVDSAELANGNSEACDAEKEQDDDEDQVEMQTDLDSRKLAGRFLLETVLPHLYGHLQDGNEIRISVAMAIVRVLKRLPQQALESRIPRLISMIMSKLSSKDQSDRDAARVTLCAVANDLGPYYLPFIVKEMMHFLRNGFKLPVLAFVLHALLDKLSPSLGSGSVDSSLSMILDITGTDLLLNVADMPKQTRESRKRQSLHSLELVAANVTFSHQNMTQIIQAYRSRMEEDPNTFTREVMRNVISRLAIGLRRNPSTGTQDMLIFIYSMLESNLEDTTSAPQSAATKQKLLDNKKTAEELVTVPKAPLRDLKPKPSKRNLTSTAIMLSFGLQLFENVISDKIYSKRTKSTCADEDQVDTVPKFDDSQNLDHDKIQSLLDPFVALLLRCVERCDSTEVSGIALRTFASLLQTVNHLPSLATHAAEFAAIMITGIQNGSATYAGICLRALTSLLRRCTVFEISEAHLAILIEFVKQRIGDMSSAPGALSLLKAVLCRKLLSKSLHDLMEQVKDIVVNADDLSIKKAAQQAVIQYLLDYPLTAKRIERYLRTYAVNMSDYVHPHGRLAALNMLSLCASRFPQSVLDQHSQLVFLPAVTRLINENSQPCLDQVESLIKLVATKVSSGACTQLMSLITVWWRSPDPALQTVAVYTARLIQGTARLNTEWLELARSTLEQAGDLLQSLLMDGSDEALGKRAQDYVPLVNHSIKLVGGCFPSSSANKCLPAILSLSLYPNSSVRMHISELFVNVDIPAPFAPWADAFLSYFCSDHFDPLLFKAAGDNLRKIVISLFEKQSELEVISRIIHRISTRSRRTPSPQVVRHCLQWILDLVNVASIELLLQFTTSIFSPADPIANAPKHACKDIAEGILQNLSQKIGTEHFLKLSTEIRTFHAEKREQRRITTAREAVLDPAKAALRKEKRSRAKKRQREKKSSIFKQRKKGLVKRDVAISNHTSTAIRKTV